MSRFLPTTRQFTGTGFRHRAYVVSEPTRRVLFACNHVHRSNATAARCATRNAARMEREDCAVSGGGR